MSYRPTTRDPLIPDAAFRNDALAELAQSLPVWGVTQTRQHVMNLAEMYFWREFLNGEPSTTLGTLHLQLMREASTHSSHCLTNPRFIWGSRTPNSMGSGAPYSHSHTDDWNSEIPAVYWPITNRFDEPLRADQGLTFWKEVLTHPRLTLSHVTGGRFASVNVTIAPSPTLLVEPWTPYFAAWMDLRDRLHRLNTVERTMLIDHHGERRHQAAQPGSLAPDTAPVRGRRPGPR